MHLIRIDFIDKKYTLISTIEIKNALELMMGGVGGGGGGEEEIRIRPHYRSVGRRQGSCAVFGESI